MSDEKDPVRVGRFEWERLMLMSVPHPTNFKLLPLGVFMSADGGRVRPGNAGLAQFGPHEKTWAKLLRWAVAEGWLLLVARGGARRGPEGRTIVRASVYAASVPQAVWERRMEILGAPPFRAASVEGSAPESLKGAPGDSPEALKGASDGSLADSSSLKGAPETPFNAPDPSLKGASRDSLPESLKGAPGVFEGSDPSFEGSVSGFEGSAQTLPHHVVLSSRSNSSSTSSTTVVAEDSAEGPVEDSDGTEGGGGGEIESSEDQEQDKPIARAETFVDSLDYRGKIIGQQRRARLSMRVVAAFKAGWTENGLRRYLDISDDPNIRDAASVYAHRLKDEELPAAAEEEPGLPPVCNWCQIANPAAEFNAKFRRDPLGRPCPNCHPASVAVLRATHLPPLCENCEQQPGAATNPNVRIDPMSFHGEVCPNCHPAKVPGDWHWPGMDTADGGMWERASVRARERGQATGARADAHTASDYAASSVDDLFAARVLPGDRNALGWLQLSRSLGAQQGPTDGPKPMVSRQEYRPFQNPTDQSVYDKGLLDGVEPDLDQSRYDEPL